MGRKREGLQEPLLRVNIQDGEEVSGNNKDRSAGRRRRGAANGKSDAQLQKCA